MSQARVTDFFCHRKRGLAGPSKPTKQRSSAVVGLSSNVASTRSRSSKNTLLCSSTVHEEFLRVIDEAAGLHDDQSAESHGEKVSSPGSRTPKRTSTDAEFDLGAAVFSATADHSTAKKKRQAEAAKEAKANAPEKGTRKSARKKLVLSTETPQVRWKPLCVFLRLCRHSVNNIKQHCF